MNERRLFEIMWRCELRHDLLKCHGHIRQSENFEHVNGDVMNDIFNRVIHVSLRLVMNVYRMIICLILDL